jgi:hypothetical protein
LASREVRRAYYGPHRDKLLVRSNYLHEKNRKHAGGGTRTRTPR